MFNLKELKKAVDQISQEKGVDASKVFEALEMSLAAAYKKEYCQKGEVVRAKFDPKTGALKFWKVKTVVDETTVRIVEEGEEAVEEDRGRFEREGMETEGVLPRYNADRHLFLKEAQEIKSDV